MVKFLTPFAAAGLAIAALALAVPVTGHAAGSGGPCFTASKGHPVQHLGSGHTSFNHSHDNCVDFTTGTNGTAFLENSDGNSLVMGGNKNTVEDFKHSDNNTIIFDSGSSNNELNAKNAVGNTVEFTSAAVNDFVLLLGTNDTTGTITIAATGASMFFSSACAGTILVDNSNAAFAGPKGKGTESHPIKIC